MLLAGWFAAALLFAGCATRPARPEATESDSASPSVTPVALSTKDQSVLDSFCKDWNEIILQEAAGDDEAEVMAVDADSATLVEEGTPMPKGTISCAMPAGRSTVTIYILDGRLIAADAASLTRDWKKGGYSNIDPTAASEWQACWKTMVLCVNDNESEPGYGALLADIANGMPRAMDRQNSQRGELVSERGWEYRMASLERNQGVLYDKRVRACDEEYADELEQWMDWL